MTDPCNYCVNGIVREDEWNEPANCPYCNGTGIKGNPLNGLLFGLALFAVLAFVCYRIWLGVS